jgi:3-methyladenine DNA glycosylase AlkC
MGRRRKFMKKITLTDSLKKNNLPINASIAWQIKNMLPAKEIKKFWDYSPMKISNLREKISKIINDGNYDFYKGGRAWFSRDELAGNKGKYAYILEDKKAKRESWKNKLDICISIEEALDRTYVASWDRSYTSVRVDDSTIAMVAWDTESDWNYYAKSYRRPKNTYTNRRVEVSRFDYRRATTKRSVFPVESFRGNFLENIFIEAGITNVKKMKNKTKLGRKKIKDKIELAINPNTPKELLVELSKDKDRFVRRAVAKNPNTPSEVLVELSKDKDVDVRYLVAKNSNTPKEVLAELSKDKDWFVRLAVAENPNTPKEVLVELSKDEDVDVRWAIAENHNNPNEILVDPKEILVELSKNKDWSARQMVARNTNTPSEVLVELSKDKNEHVRQAVAENTNTPKEIKEENNGI